MDDKNNKHHDINQEAAEAPEVMDVMPDEEVSEAAEVEGVEEIESLKNLLQQRDEELEKQKKEYLFLMAEFDNFRKRNVRERSELLKNAAEGVLKGLLPIVDDFERGLAAIKDSNDADAVKEGMELIYNKLVKYLEQNGVKEIPTKDADFDTEFHEAIAMVPVEDPALKGKVIDTVSKGYTLNDKVIRHAKVAVGQ
ncbi:MAG: nucleotide exchange factor GrpE [Bacteroidales bacterium]|nr:nucleotide exchange factor GrpE [Bacteroidales bacterium]